MVTADPSLAASAVPRVEFMIFGACAGWALLGSLLTAMTDRKDVAHYYETYDWIELADGLYIASMLGLFLASVGGPVVFAQRDRITGPAGSAGLGILAGVAALIAVAAVAILRYGRRVFVPGSLAGASAGVCVVAALGLVKVQHLGLVVTAALGWVSGLGAAIVIMIVAFVVMAVTDPMP